MNLHRKGQLGIQPVAGKLRGDQLFRVMYHPLPKGSPAGLGVTVQCCRKDSPLYDSELMYIIPIYLSEVPILFPHTSYLLLSQHLFHRTVIYMFIFTMGH